MDRPLFKVVGDSPGSWGVELLVSDAGAGRYYIWGLSSAGEPLQFLDVPEGDLYDLSAAFIEGVNARLSSLYGQLGDESFTSVSSVGPIIYNF